MGDMNKSKSEHMQACSIRQRLGHYADNLDAMCKEPFIPDDVKKRLSTALYDLDCAANLLNTKYIKPGLI